MSADSARPLRLLADENLQRSLVQALRGDSFDVAYVAESAAGISEQLVGR